MTNILLHIFAFIGVFFSCVTTVSLIILALLTIQYRIQERRRKKEDEKKAKEVYDRAIKTLEEREVTDDKEDDFGALDTMHSEDELSCIR